jgi:hypothetical protein
MMMIITKPKEKDDEEDDNNDDPLTPLTFLVHWGMAEVPGRYIHGRWQGSFLSATLGSSSSRLTGGALSNHLSVQCCTTSKIY